MMQMTQHCYLQIYNAFLKMGNLKEQIELDKTMNVLFATFQSQAPDPISGDLKIQGKIS